MTRSQLVKVGQYCGLVYMWACVYAIDRALEGSRLLDYLVDVFWPPMRLCRSDPRGQEQKFAQVGMQPEQTREQAARSHKRCVLFKPPKVWVKACSLHTEPALGKGTGRQSNQPSYNNSFNSLSPTSIPPHPCLPQSIAGTAVATCAPLSSECASKRMRIKGRGIMRTLCARCLAGGTGM